MDLPPGILDFIDQYVSEALETTGTRKAKPLPAPPPQMPPPPISFNVDTLLPIHMDFEDHTNPENQFAEEDGTAWLAPALQPRPRSKSEPDALPRERAPRSSASPLVIVELEEDDEITNVVGKPTK